MTLLPVAGFQNMIQNAEPQNHSNENSTNETLFFINKTLINATSDNGRFQLEYSLHYAIGLAAVCFIGGIENALILLTLSFSKRLRSSYYAFIGNLATAQLLFCLVIGIAFGWVRIVYFLYSLSPRTTMLVCAAGMIPYHAGQVCALCTRFVIGIDRLFAFSLPLEYRTRNKCYAPTAMSACWLWPIIEVLVYFGINYADFRHREMPMCSGSGWKTGAFLTYTAYRDLAVGGLTALTYLVTAALVTRKFVLLKFRRGRQFEFQSKPYQFRLLIASGTDATIFTACNLMAYVVRTFLMMQLDGTHRLAANFSVGLLLASTNVTDFLLYLAINRDFRGEFLALLKPKRRDRAISWSNNSATAILHGADRAASTVAWLRRSLCDCCSLRRANQRDERYT